MLIDVASRTGTIKAILDQIFFGLIDQLLGNKLAQVFFFEAQ